MHYAGIFLVVVLAAALFGFGRIADELPEIAKLLFYLFVVRFVASLSWGLIRSRLS